MHTTSIENSKDIEKQHMSINDILILHSGRFSEDETFENNSGKTPN
jgi:hypothetical protein